jgi:hypothetical protein
MSSVQLAKPGYVLIAGTPVLFSNSIDRKLASNDKIVHTVGGTGHSDGVTVVDFTVKNAVPQAGYEFDAYYYATTHVDLVLQFKLAGWIETVEGRIMEDSVTTSPENPTEQTFTFQGVPVGRVRA